MGQAHLWLNIGPIKVPRPPPGSDFHETDTRNPIFGVPGPLGAKLGNFELGGGGPMYAIVYPASGHSGRNSYLGFQTVGPTPQMFSIVDVGCCGFGAVFDVLGPRDHVKRRH